MTNQDYYDEKVHTSNLFDFIYFFLSLISFDHEDLAPDNYLIITFFIFINNM